MEYFIVIKKLQISSDVDFSYTKFGKPYLPKTKYHFSISHSRDLLVVAFSEHPIGVDVQYLLPFKDDTAGLICNQDEYTAIAANKNCHLAFTKLWTQKESIVKLYGETLYQDTKNILQKHRDVTVHTKCHKDYVISISLKFE